jgi:hypothetical protein
MVCQPSSLNFVNFLSSLFGETIKQGVGDQLHVVAGLAKRRQMNRWQAPDVPGINRRLTVPPHTAHRD